MTCHASTLTSTLTLTFIHPPRYVQMDPELFSAFADYLRPDNTLTWRVWKGEETKRKERASRKKKGPEPVGLGLGLGLDQEEAGRGAAAATVRGEGIQPLLEERWWVLGACVCGCVLFAYFASTALTRWLTHEKTSFSYCGASKET